MLCPTNTISPALSGNNTACSCAPGAYGTGVSVACVLCPASSYCAGGNANTKSLCPLNAWSPIGSANITQCQCLPGYVGLNGTNCTLCPNNTVCVSGILNPCIGNASSTAGTSTKCMCNAGFYSAVSGVWPCIACPAGSYCTGDTIKLSCTANANSATQAIDSTLCTCNAGWVGERNAACTQCSAGSWCANGVPHTCLSNSYNQAGSGVITSCLCNAGYEGANGGICAPCSPGNQTLHNATYICSVTKPYTTLHTRYIHLFMMFIC